MTFAALVSMAVLGLGQVGGARMAIPAPLPPSVGQAAPAGEAAGLGLGDLERMALEHNPTLAQAIERFEQNRGRAIQAGAYPNPLLVWTGSSWGNQSTAGTQEGFIQQPIVTGGKIRANRSRYEMDVEIARLAVQEQRMQVQNGVRLRWLQVLAQQRILGLETAAIGLAGKVVRTTREKVATGHASEADLLMAENEVAERELDLAQLRERYENTWRELAAFVGCPAMRPARLSGRLEEAGPTLEWEPTRERLLAESPELRVAELRILRAQYTLKRERKEPIPDLVIRAGGAYLPTNNQTVGYSRIYLDFPIWDQNRGNIHTAEHGLMETRQDLVRLRLNLQQRLSRTFNHYRTSEASVRRLREEILPRARRAFELYYQSFQKEEASYSRVESSMQAYVEANLRYLMQLLELRRAEAAIAGLLVVGERVEPESLSPPGSGLLVPPGEGLPNPPAGGGVPVGRPSRVESP